MPNHCTNVVVLKGDFKHRQEFVDKNKGFEWGDKMKEGAYKELSFHAQVPILIPTPAIALILPGVRLLRGSAKYLANSHI
jgi:hypothetical protein